ncbi:MAG TPA: hypothetical protein VM261_23455 [Kofleriaceae bacterium]|nr:hypothetical protein [Kofleriaceae bacterium]
MSSSFFVRRGPPDDAAAVIAALERPGVRWADGELDELVGPWPEGVVVLWIPGASTRGVEVITHSDGKMAVRILAMSSPEDYDLALRLVEVLGGDRPVEPEEGEPLPAAQVRKRFDREWMLRNMATGATAIGVALARGKRVTMSGPSTNVTIEPVQPFDAVAFLDTMRSAQASALADGEQTERAGRIVEDVEDDPRTPWQEIEDGDLLTGEQEHRDELQARDKKLAPASPAADRGMGLGWRLVFYAVVILLIVPALVTRLMTWPFRRRIVDRREEREDERRHRERETCREEVVRETAHLALTPDDIDSRRRRADRLWRLGHRAAAERDLAFCLAKLPEHDVRRELVLIEQSGVLRMLGCPNLADAAQAAAVARGVKLVPASPVRHILDGAGGAFIVMAGLHDY